LSVRASNCLESARINTVGELVQWDEARLLSLRSFGKTSLREVKRKLADHGLSLGMGAQRTASASFVGGVAQDDEPGDAEPAMHDYASSSNIVDAPGHTE
jgi:hypothetical protein